MTLYPDVDTPALLFDLDTVERNIAELATVAADAGVALRPHTKTHKSPLLARMQLQAGAAGITVALSRRRRAPRGCSTLRSTVGAAASARWWTCWTHTSGRSS